MQSNGMDEVRVLVLLCTYNEAQNLPLAVEGINAALPRADVLVVDDASPDGTGRWVEKQTQLNSHLYLLSRSGKLGLGTALQAGIRWCLDREYDYLINLDADLSHSPAAAPSLLNACSDPASQPPCDVVVGTRYRSGGSLEGIAWHRRLISRVLNAYAIRLLRLPISDCSGSFRCYRVAALRKLNLEQLTCKGYGFLEEILVHLYRRGAAFCEVPIQFEARLKGHSKLSLSDAWGALQVIHRLAFFPPRLPTNDNMPE
jgi:dolichol-phosphate mannosyltransferase